MTPRGTGKNDSTASRPMRAEGATACLIEQQRLRVRYPRVLTGLYNTRVLHTAYG